MTQATLAKSVGTGQDLISRYERGQIRPTFARLQRLAKALGVKPEAIAIDIF